MDIGGKLAAFSASQSRGITRSQWRDGGSSERPVQATASVASSNAIGGVAVIDYHTGLGPYGYGERIVTHPAGSAGFARARQWYGDNITSTSLGTSRSSEVTGDLMLGLEEALPEAEVTTMALEYGVRPLQETIDAVRADNWLHTRGRLDTPQGRDIKAMMRATFYGDADDWKDMIFEQAIDAQRRALRGLAG